MNDAGVAEINGAGGRFDDAIAAALRGAGFIVAGAAPAPVTLLINTSEAEISPQRCHELANAAPDGAEARVVNILDRRALAPSAETSPAWLEQAGRWTLTRNLALALAPRVRVNAIGLGWGDIDAADVVGAILYLARAPAVTGQMVALGRDREAAS